MIRREIGCEWSAPLRLRANAGQTYFFQVAFSDYFELRVTPPPNVFFYPFPSDPSTFDDTHFSNGSYDPAGADLTFDWQFGDGATSTEQSPTHRYLTEGDYTAHLIATTTDGRTASASSLIQVRNHDVVITKFTVPTSARAGQTKQTTVEIRNTRYPETVRVELLRSIPGGGFQAVGSLTQSAPVRHRTTSFTINYTFTQADVTA